MAAADLSVSRLREMLSYNRRTGLFRWLKRPCNSVRAGDIAGSVGRDHGYVQIQLDGVIYRAHRLAVLHVTGCWPTGEVDHQNGRRADNKWRNLRDGTKAINMQNKRAAHSSTQSGLLGAYFDKTRGRYKAAIGVDGRLRHIGWFRTAKAAHAAYLTAKRVMHQGCTI